MSVKQEDLFDEETHNFEATEAEDQQLGTGRRARSAYPRQNYQETILRSNQRFKLNCNCEEPDDVVLAFRIFGRVFRVQRCECIQLIFLIMLLGFIAFVLIGTKTSSERGH